MKMLKYNFRPSACLEVSINILGEALFPGLGLESQN